MGSGDECAWHGVSCDVVGAEGGTGGTAAAMTVTSIELGQNNLQGDIPTGPLSRWSRFVMV